jgi:hypothetical protein
MKNVMHNSAAILHGDFPPKQRVGDMATHGGDIRLIDQLAKFRSAKEQHLIDLIFYKLQRGDREGLERSLRSKSVASLRRRGVLRVERDR